MVALLPTVTLPNDAADGLAARASLFTPEPSTRSEKAGYVVLENKIVPLVHPCLVGVKLILRLKLWPGANDMGRLNSEVVKSELVPFMESIVMVAAPLFVRVTSSVSV